MVVAISLGGLVVEKMPYNLEGCSISVIELLYNITINKYIY